MASITSSGIGSGLDVNSLVAQLVAAERQPAQQRLSTVESKAQVRLSALGTFRSALANLQSSAAALKSSGALGAMTATASDTSLFSATAVSGAAAGKFDVEVVQLARANKLASGTFTSSATVLPAGSMTLTVDGESFTVNTSGTDTLADLRSAINAATDNTGVVATIVNEDGGSRLLLTAKQTGLDNAVSVSTSLSAFTEIQGALDAHIRLEGNYDVYSAVNSISGAIDGVTLNLIKAAPGTTATLDVSVDNKTAADAVQKFVGAYNALLITINSLSKYNTSTNTAAALTGDITVRSAHQQLRSLLSSEITGGSLTQLSQVGITTTADGSLKLDSAKLATALSGDYAAVEKLFSGTNGYAKQVDSLLDGYLDTGGRLEAATKTEQARIDDVDEQKDALARRMSMLEARYRAQFTALDTLMSQLQTTSTFLSNQLSALTKSNN